MPDDRDGVGPSPPDGTDVETLRTTREEARLVLDHQLQVLNEIDRKAIRTVQVVLVLLGLVGTTATVVEVRHLLNPLSLGGLLSLVGALVLGLLTYTASNPETGVGSRYLQDSLEEAYEELEWLAVLLKGYGEWLDRMERINARNARLLTWTQTLTVLGVVSLTAGTGVALSGSLLSVLPQVFT